MCPQGQASELGAGVGTDPGEDKGFGSGSVYSTVYNCLSDQLVGSAADSELHTAPAVFREGPRQKGQTGQRTEQRPEGGQQRILSDYFGASRQLAHCDGQAVFEPTFWVRIWGLADLGGWVFGPKPKP